MDLLFAWIASITSGLEPLVIKVSSKSLVTNPWRFNLLWVLFGIPFVSGFALLKGATLPHNWVLVLLMSAFSAGFYILYTLALYKIDVSVMAPLFSIRTVFAVILGVWLLNEPLSPIHILLIVVILAFSPLAAYDEHVRIKSFLQKPVLLALLAMFSLALYGFFINASSRANGYATTLFWQDILVFLYLLPTVRLAAFDRRTFTRSSLLPFVLLGFSEFVYAAAATAAFSHNLALSSVIVSLPLSMFFVIALSKKYGDLLERHPRKTYAIRLAAATVMVSAAIVLSLR